MVTTLDIAVTFLSPAHFGSRPAEGNLLRTMPYVPGPALRGALACHYIDDIPGPAKHDAGFFRWAFVDGHLHWPELYWENGELVPLSRRQCKYDQGHRPVDMIWQSHGTEPRCPDCDNALERPDPTWPIRSPITRTAIDSAVRGALDRSLHTVEVIEAGQRFSGTIRAFDAPGEKWQQLCTWLEQIAESPPALGGGRSRGLGAVKIETSATPNNSKLQERLTTWNAGRSDRTQFAITLETGTILRDSLWRWQRSIGQQALADIYPDLPPLELVRAWSSAVQVGGWNNAACMPREDALAITRGSTFLYETSGDIKAIASVLERIEAEGLGERRSEGYGRAAICHQTHLDSRPTKEAIL